jgi:hypothetical protein
LGQGGRTIELNDMLTGEVKLTEFGAAISDSARGRLSKEDQKAVELAERAQRGDYDDGKIVTFSGDEWGLMRL